MAEKPKNEAPPDDDIEDGAETDGGEESGTEKKFKKPSKKLLIMVAGLLMLLGAAAAGAHFMGLLGGGDEQATASATHNKKPEKTVFYDLPELLVNLNSAGRRTNFLKITVSLEVANETDIAKLEAVKPRIVDSFQMYLRELRLDDLRGSAGVYRLREELLARVMASAQNAQVKDVLFKEMLVQ